MSAYALISVDTEPDNVWRNYRSRGLDNLAGLRRFHRLCQRFDVRPTYLVTHSVAIDDAYAAVLNEWRARRECEIGAHPHLWEIAPMHPIDQSPATAILYPAAVLRAKLKGFVAYLRERFGDIRSHRAGRWGFQAGHADHLAALGIDVDSSVTPGMDWTRSDAPDFSDQQPGPHLLGATSVLEIPCTIQPPPKLARRLPVGVRPLGRYLGLGPGWLRCHPRRSARRLIQISDWGLAQFGFVNVMTHSSELIPAGSPYWRTAAAVERHLARYEALFAAWKRAGVQCLTFSEFSQSWRRNNRPGSEAQG